MAKENILRRMVYVGIGLVIAEAAFFAFVVIPRLAIHPECVKSTQAYWFFAKIRLVVAAALLAFFIPNRHNLRRIKAFLTLVGVLVIVLSFPMFSGAHWYLDKYGFYDMANLLSICIGANLIAAILFITVPIMLRRSSSSK